MSCKNRWSNADAQKFIDEYYGVTKDSVKNLFSEIVRFRS